MFVSTACRSVNTLPNNRKVCSKVCLLACDLEKLISCLQVTSVENPATNKAGRNAIMTSMIVCCGFLVCWSFGDITYFLPTVGVTVNLPLWFYHFTNLSLLYNTNSLASNAATYHFLYTSSVHDLSNIFVLPLH